MKERERYPEVWWRDLNDPGELHSGDVVRITADFRVNRVKVIDGRLVVNGHTVKARAEKLKR